MIQRPMDQLTEDDSTTTNMGAQSDCSTPAVESESATSSSRRSSISLGLPMKVDDPPSTGLPCSSNFEVRQTAFAGRAVFASHAIPAGTTIWRSEDLSLSVLLREYRREVCGYCFRYENGRDLALRDKNVGYAFCSGMCRAGWMKDNGEVGVQAWSAVEKWTKGRKNEDSDMVEPDLPRPTPKEIIQGWEGVAGQAVLIQIAREGEREKPRRDGEEGGVRKQHKRALQKALQQPIAADVMSFCVNGILWRHHHAAEWNRVLALAIDETPYHSADELQTFINTYLTLLAILPFPLLYLVTPETMFTLSSRDSHNSFGIRSLEDEGSEFFGFGCWPGASYFNHSCNPNVEKQRQGRAWTFTAGRDIARGDELCITYLSGEERKLGREERMARLRNWGFDCNCDRCAMA